MQVITPCIGETIRIGEGITVTILKVSGAEITLEINAAPGVPIIQTKSFWLHTDEIDF